MEEAKSWLGDRKPLLTSEDQGKDESSTGSLLQRHLRLEKEMVAYASEMKRLLRAGEERRAANCSDCESMILRVALDSTSSQFSSLTLR